MAGAAQLQVLTLNTWGLWLVSKDRVRRMKELGNFLRTTPEKLDVVCLQEVWVDGDAQFLMRCAQQGGLPHGVHFKSGIFGSGLVTLSRHPILESGFQRYSASGDAAAITCGDFLAGKGVGWVRLVIPDSPPLTVFNTHLHANYSHNHKALTSSNSAGQKAAQQEGMSVQYKIPCDGFAGFRISQMHELAQVIRHVGSGPGPLILAGDLNSKPQFLELMLLRHLLPELVDCWTWVHGEEADAKGYTCRADGCSYKSTRQVPERIDYVMAAGLVPESCDVTLRTTRAGCSYSDHFAVQARLSFPTAAEACKPPPQQLVQAGVGLAAGRHPWSLYQAQGQHFHTQPTGAAAKAGREPDAAVLQDLQQVLTDALTTLERGAKLYRRHKAQRLLATGFLLFVAYLSCGLPHCPRNPKEPVADADWQAQVSYAFLHWCSTLPGCIPPLLSAATTGMGMLLMCLALVADATQARVLWYSHAQLKALMERALGAEHATGSEH